MHNFGPLHVRSSEPIPSESVVPEKTWYLLFSPVTFIEKNYLHSNSAAIEIPVTVSSLIVIVSKSMKTETRKSIHVWFMRYQVFSFLLRL